jgi:hypothetical protein
MIARVACTVSRIVRNAQSTRRADTVHEKTKLPSSGTRVLVSENCNRNVGMEDVTSASNMTHNILEGHPQTLLWLSETVLLSYVCESHSGLSPTMAEPSSRD